MLTQRRSSTRQALNCSAYYTLRILMQRICRPARWYPVVEARSLFLCLDVACFDDERLVTTVLLLLPSKT
jgi:hypothetical protein